MTAWTSDELRKIDAVDELRIQTRRHDGSLRNPVTIWMVRVGDDLYVRSVNGPTAAWYRGTQARHDGHIEAGGVDKDVTFEDVSGAINQQVDAAYQAKYRRYPSIVPRMVRPEILSTTLKLVPSAS